MGSYPIKKELAAFATKGTKRKRPNYYILATNVVLSPVQNGGGKDRASQLVEKFAKEIDLRDYRIWDHDQICRYIDCDHSIRAAYAAWITPGDVLAKLAAEIESRVPDFTRVMTTFLQKEVLDDHFSKLEQAGHSPENRIPLEKKARGQVLQYYILTFFVPSFSPRLIARLMVA